MKKSTVKRLEEIKSVCQLIEKLKSNLRDYHYFSNSSNISRLSDYGLTDKLRDKFKEVQVKYSSMVYESLEKFKTYSIKVENLELAKECYGLLIKMKDECDKGNISLRLGNSYFSDKFIDRKFIFDRLKEYLDQAYKEYCRIVQEEIIILEDKLEDLLVTKTEVIQVKSDYIRNIALLSGYKDDNDGSYSFKDEEKEIHISRIPDSDEFKLLISGSGKSYTAEFPEVYAYSGLYEFLCKSRLIKSLDALISSVKFCGYTKFDERLSNEFI